MVKIKKLAYKDLFHIFGDPGTKEGKEKILNEVFKISQV